MYVFSPVLELFSHACIKILNQGSYRKLLNLIFHPRDIPTIDQLLRPIWLPGDVSCYLKIFIMAVNGMRVDPVLQEKFPEFVYATVAFLLLQD